MPLLDVPYFKQFNTNACLAASTAMLLAYHGFSFSQRDIFNVAKFYTPHKRKVAGCTEVGIMDFLGKNYQMTYWMDVKKKKWPSEMEWFHSYLKKVKKSEKKKLIIRKKGASLAFIRKMIDQKKPVIAEVHMNTWTKTKKYAHDVTHDVVVTGYDSKYFFFNDPFNPYLRKKGKNFKTTIAHFKKSRETFPVYQRVILNIEKIA